MTSVRMEIIMQDFRMNTFLAVCQYMNYTHAADALHITQPAVSQHIRYLEKEYGVQLFIQEGKKIRLSEAGELLLDAAQTFRHNEINLKSKMLRTKTGVEHYSFGATRTVSEYMLTKQIEHFLIKHPDCRLSMLVNNTSALLKLLDDSVIDFAIVEGDFPRNEYSYLPFSNERFVAFATPDIAAKYKNKSVNELFHERLIIREQGSGSRNIFEGWLKNMGYDISHFSNVTEIGNIGAINSLVKDGFGMAFGYYAAVDEHVKEGELSVIDIEGMDISHDIMFIYRKKSIYEKMYVKIYEEMRDNPHITTA